MVTQRQDWTGDVQPRFVEVLRDMLQRFGIMRVMEYRGEGSIGGSASFQLFGAGPADRSLIMDVYLRLLVATENFPPAKQLHLDKTYRLSRNTPNGQPKLVHGYTITGWVETTQEAQAIMEALDISEFQEVLGREVMEARFYVPDGMGGIMPSPERNVPANGADSPNGETGMRGAYVVRDGNKYA